VALGGRAAVRQAPAWQSRKSRRATRLFVALRQKAIDWGLVVRISPSNESGLCQSKPAEAGWGHSAWAGHGPARLTAAAGGDRIADVVSDWGLTIALAANGLLMIGLPLALAVVLTRRFGQTWRLIGIGAGTFVLSQVAHIPANLGLGWLFTSSTVPELPSAWKLPVSAAIAGLSAGLLEEGARYAMYRWWARDARSWSKALLLGSGHGGAEAVLLGLLALYSLVRLFSLRGVDLSTLVPAEQLAAAQQQINAYWNMPWYAALLGALERTLTIPVQIGMSVLVLQVFTRGQLRWLWLAIGWHAVTDGVIVGYLVPTLQAYTWAPYAIEGAVAVTTAISLSLIFLLRRPEPEPAPYPAVEAAPAMAFRSREIPVTEETLEGTRYYD
jgi:uncharacterized membrane protein YhfC